MKIKTTLAAIACSATLFASQSHADFLGFEVGAAAWANNMDVTAQGSNKTTELPNTVNGGFYASFEHPVPMIPNVRINVDTIENEGKVSQQKAITDTSFIDALLYWEVLDTIAEIDLGIGARMYDGKSGSKVNPESFDATLGVAFAKAQVNVPITGLSVGANVMIGQGSSDNKATDARGFVRWESVLGLGLEGGYRILNQELEITNNNVATIDLDGAYLSAFFHF